MDDFHTLLASPWGAEQWIHEGWQQITLKEKTLIRTRMDDLFKNGLPFELKHDKMLYLYAFALLAQLEVLAIQIPLKFEKKVAGIKLKQQMRAQLLDEIFHGLAFTKVVYLLCEPYAHPPQYNAPIEALCHFVRQESCPKISMVLLNLIGEGWIEEVFKSLYRQNVAPDLFAIIISDEHRHVDEADLYCDIGLPDITLVREKLDSLEMQLVAIFSQYKYASSIKALLGIQGSVEFVQALDHKYRTQLSKIQLTPGSVWQSFMQINDYVLPHWQDYAKQVQAIPMSHGKQLFMTQWDNPTDPTMVGEFDINISCLDFFNKKYPPQTLTTLMLQTISQTVADHDALRCFLSHKQLHQCSEAYVALAVKLPNCHHHIGCVVFKNSHQMPLLTLNARIQYAIHMMSFCYQEREALEKKHPHLITLQDNELYDFNFGTYDYPNAGSSMVTLSNIGAGGYVRAKSPLRSNESLKFTMLEVQRKPIWNHETQQLELQDRLPVSISADHRLFDGNMPAPKWICNIFKQKYEHWINSNEETPKPHSDKTSTHQRVIEQLIPNHLEELHKTLIALQSTWFDFIDVDDFFNAVL